MLLPLYAFIAWMLLASAPMTAAIFFSASFLGDLRILHARSPHARAILLRRRHFFALPLAARGARRCSAVFALLTLSCLFNLAYVLHTLQTVVFLNPHDPARDDGVTLQSDRVRRP
jgi:hypothetical protein